MPAAAPAVLLLSLDTQQGVPSIILAMTRRYVGKPAFSLRKKRFVKTHALSLLGTTRLLSRSDGFKAVEIQFPYTLSASTLRNILEQQQLKLQMFNTGFHKMHLKKIYLIQKFI